MTTTLPQTTTNAEASPDEWALRVQLAAAYRIFDHMGWCELVYGHISMRLPRPEHHFLINPYGMRYDEITASSLIEIDLEGNVVSGNHPFNPAGFVIHSAIHEHRDDAHCVMHTHTRSGMAMAAVDCNLEPVSMNAMSFHGRVAYHEFEGSTLLLEEREKLADDLGSANTLILRNHGLLTVGQTIPEAFLHLYRLERACQVQLDAMAAGPLRYPSPESIDRSVRQMEEFGRCAADFGQLEFDALVRAIDQKAPSFRE